MKAFFLICIALLLVGCVPVDSLNPIYTEKDVIFDPALVGTWVGENPDEGNLRIARAGQNAYQFVMTERKDDSWMKTSVYQARLVSLGGEKFLDVQPMGLDLSDQADLNIISSKKGVRFEPPLVDIGAGLFVEFFPGRVSKGKGQHVQMRLRQSHWIFKADLDHGFLRLAYLDNEWINNEVKRGTLLARNQRAKTDFADKWVLTGSTAELQQFVVEQADREGAFSGGIALKRQKEAAQQSKDSGS